MKSLSMAAATLLLATSPATVALAAEAPKPPAKSAAKAEAVLPSDLKWVDAPIKGIHFAPLWGDASKGAHGRFIRFDAGHENPPHTHSSTLRSVVVSGTFYTGADAASAKELGPGSYATTPGGWKHVSGCRAGSDCVIYEESAGRFDLKPVGGAKPAAAAK